jgi:hypothetical protein
MPEIIIKATYLRGRSVFFHQLAKEHDKAGNHPVWEKLTEFAADHVALNLQAQPDYIEGVASAEAFGMS